MIQYKDLKLKNKTELLGLLKSLRIELANLMLKKITSGIEKPNQIKDFKKNIAQIMFLVVNK